MKKMIQAAMICGVVVCGGARAQEEGPGGLHETESAAKRILIVYYSKTGNTEAIARMIQEATDGDVFRIVPVTPYPEDYRETTEQAKKEIAEGFLPPIQAGGHAEEYDMVFVGSPCWWGTIAPPVSTYLSTTDLSGKTVVPFSTHGGSGLAGNARATAELATGATVLPGKAFRGAQSQSSRNAVLDWLKELGL